MWNTMKPTQMGQLWGKWAMKEAEHGGAGNDSVMPHWMTCCKEEIQTYRQTQS